MNSDFEGINTLGKARCSAMEALENLLPFTRIYEPNSIISKVGFKENMAYATDKRIAVRVQTYMVSPSHPDGYPFEKLDNILSGVCKIREWFKIDPTQFEGLTKIFLEKVAKGAEENAHETHGRYVSVECPDCGEPMFFDLDKNQLVKEMKRDPFDPKIVPYNGRIFLDRHHLNIGFGYLYTAYRTFEEGLEFSRLEGTNGNPDMLAMRTSDNLVAGVLMPLTVEDDFNPEWSIIAERV